MNKQYAIEIPAVLMHDIDGVCYRVNGTLVDINESAGTCSMRFDDYPVQSGIPMGSVYLNEGFLDKIKEYGKKAKDYINKLVKAVGGFLFPVNEEGEPDLRFAISPINFAIAAGKRLIGDKIHFYPADGLLKELRTQGVDAPVNQYSPGAYSELTDSIECNAYWTRVMKEHFKNENMTVQDAIDYVNEHYYNIKKDTKALNEAPTISLTNLVDGQHGETLGTRVIIKRIQDSILTQVGARGDRSDTATERDNRPLFIWGAPGIGKTTIINTAFKKIKASRQNLDINLISISLDGLYPESFTLPQNVTNVAGQNVVGEVPKFWLPVYYRPTDPAELKRVDEFYNNGTYAMAKGLNIGQGFETEEALKAARLYDGGIIFLDEFMRGRPEVLTMFMKLLSDGVFMNMYLPSKWGFICASNRAQDDLKNADDYKMPQAMADRFHHCTYVPTKDEWLDWAARKNEITGRSNIDKLIRQYIQQGVDGIWYDAITLGSRDNIAQRLSPEDIEIIKRLKNTDTNLIKDRMEAQSEYPQTILALYNATWTGRTWERDINQVFFNILNFDIFANYPDLYKGENGIFDENGDIDLGKLKQNLDLISAREWEDILNDELFEYCDKFDPQHKMSRLAFVLNILQAVISSATGGDDFLPGQEFKKFISYKNIFTPEELRHIWETGEFSDPVKRADDNLTFSKVSDYQRRTEFSQWKTATNLVNEVNAMITNTYSDNELRDMALSDIIEREEMEKDPHRYDGQLSKLFDKWREYFTVTLRYADDDSEGKNKFQVVKFSLFTDSDRIRLMGNHAATPEESYTPDPKSDEYKCLQNLVYMLEDSEHTKDKFIIKVMNATKYLVKVALQRGSHGDIQNNDWTFAMKIKSAVKNDLSGHADKVLRMTETNAYANKVAPKGKAGDNGSWDKAAEVINNKTFLGGISHFIRSLNQFNLGESKRLGGSKRR